jgi:hypothetical protein
MARGRVEVDDEEGAAKRATDRKQAPPIPLEPVNLIAGLAPGVELVVDDLPAGVAGAGRDPADDRHGRRDRSTAPLQRGDDPPAHSYRRAPADSRRRPDPHPRSDVDAYRHTLGIGTPDKPSE